MTGRGRRICEEEFNLISKLVDSGFKHAEVIAISKRGAGTISKISSCSSYDEYCGVEPVEVEEPAKEVGLDPVLELLTGIYNGIESLLELQRKDYEEKKEWLSRKRRFF